MAPANPPGSSLADISIAATLNFGNSDMSLELYAAFIAATVAFVLLSGSNAALTTANSIAYGRRFGSQSLKQVRQRSSTSKSRENFNLLVMSDVIFAMPEASVADE